jgi:hypothetical protein
VEVDMLIATFSHSSKSERSDWKAKAGSLHEALVLAVEDEYGIGISLRQAKDAIARAKKKGETSIRTGDGPLVVWWEDNGENFGFGEGKCIAESDKYSNVWIKLADWKPDEEKRERYMAMEKEELVAILLEREALA